MLQKSKMTRSHKGMRGGISLVEMLIAVILFGVIASISYSYYKNYYDTSFAAKQLRVYVIMDQATQLSTAFDIYEVKNGFAPATIQAMVDDKILTDTPVAQPFVTNTGWVINAAVEVDGGVTPANDTVFQYDLDSVVGTAADKLDYCNILDNTADTSWSLDQAVSTAISHGLTAAEYILGTGSATSQQEYFHCAANGGAAAFEFIFVKAVDPL